MNVSYIKPSIKSYSAGDILEELCPCQNQYTTITLNTTTGNISVNVDGDVMSNGDVTTDEAVAAGDEPDDTYIRGLFGFNISSIHSTVVSATLRVYQYEVGGTPYESLGGSIRVDHVNFGSSIALEDLTGNTLTSNIGTISTSATIGWKTLDVTNYVQADLDSGRTSSQYRIRFVDDTDLSGSEDYALFESAENYGGTLSYPQLVVTYK